MATGHLLDTKIVNLNDILGNVSAAMQQKIMAEKQWLHPTVTLAAPKIAKGENYLQLPYLLLDYPRCFTKEAVFAVRTMFWWGNFFSCTLHISGSYKVLYQQALVANIAALQNNDFYICINKNEWEHHFLPENYVAANTLTEEEIKSILLQQHFIKVAAKFPLHQWNKMEVLLQKAFTDVLQLLKN